MIKNITILSLTLFLFTSCGENIEELGVDKNGMENNFMISGDIEGGGNTNFYLEAISNKGNIDIAQTKSDASGKFSIKGNIPGFGIFQLRMGKKTNNKNIPLTLAPNDKVNITSNLTNYAATPTLSGTNWAPVMTEYMELFSDFQNNQKKLVKLQGKVSNEELKSRILAMKKNLDNFAISSMEKDPSNEFNIILSSYAMPMMGFESWDSKNIKVLKKVSNAYNSKYKNSPIASTLKNQIQQIEIAYNKYKTNISGQETTPLLSNVTAPEIVLNKPDGSEIRLSELRGKYVMIDFWASWCGPCRKENPNMVRLYNQYKNKDFTIFSISLDKNIEAWKNAIDKDGLIWPNHGSDLKMWDTPLISLYDFNSIPYTVLVDKNGIIIASGLRGQKLEEKLKELFN